MKKELKVGTRFKELLKLMEPYAKDFKGKMVKGRKFQDSSLKPIEMWGNWLLVAVLRKFRSGKITIADERDAREGDGTIFVPDAKKPQIGRGYQTEHVSVLDGPNYHETLLQNVRKKVKKGYDNPKKLHLIILSAGVVRRDTSQFQLAIDEGKSTFRSVCLIERLPEDRNGFAYWVTFFLGRRSKQYKVQINPEFNQWSIVEI